MDAGNVQNYSSCKVTEIKVKEFDHVWRLNFFKYICNSGQTIQNKGDIDGLKAWNISLTTSRQTRFGVSRPDYGALYNSHKRNFINLNVTFCKDSFRITSDPTFFGVYIINMKGKECPMYTSFEETSNFISFGSEEVLFDKEKGLLLDGLHLILKFKIRFPTVITDASKNTFYPIKNVTKPLELESILNDKRNSDVTFIIDNKKLYAYKGILTKQSPVFAAMFQHKMKEKILKIIRITDVKYEIMLEVLRFLYARKINNIKDVTQDVLVAADKYGIEELKMYCEQILINTLTVQNVVELLKFADTYNANTLKDAALQYFKLQLVNCDKLKTLVCSILPSLSDVLLNNILR